MHWLRIDRYYEGDEASSPNTYFQPVLCMHCEKAPCELVCPVEATMHSDEGLNEMTYNRCVGTRYCSNNCPYKVRRFNFFQYADETTPSLKLHAQPRRDGADPRRDGEVHLLRAADQRRRGSTPRSRTAPSGATRSSTACQAACPTRAIVFGNLNDPREQRRQGARPSPRNYGLLAELNTRPRTTYLAQLRNPNPEIEAESRAIGRNPAMAIPQPDDIRRTRPAPVLAPGHTYGSVTDKISALVLIRPYNWRWFLGWASASP